MATRKLKKSNLRKTQENNFAHSVMESTQQIWLAGVGAFAVAQKEGSKLFDSLVQEGEQVEARTREVAESTVDEVKDQVKVARQQANRKWDKLEQVFQDRVARALNSLGVPTSKDLQELTREVKNLSKNVENLTQV